MSNTIGHIKRQAKRIKKTEGIKHSEALERAARHAGFQNYHHALNQSQKDPNDVYHHRQQ